MVNYHAETLANATPLRRQSMSQLEFLRVLDAERTLSWIGQHLTGPDGEPAVLHQWQRDVLKSFGRPTARRLQIDRPECLWHPSR